MHKMAKIYTHASMKIQTTRQAEEEKEIDRSRKDWLQRRGCTIYVRSLFL